MKNRQEGDAHLHVVEVEVFVGGNEARVGKQLIKISCGLI